jgi:hypothetical protein
MLNHVRQVLSDLRSGANDVPRQGLGREKCVHKANNAAVAVSAGVAGVID